MSGVTAMFHQVSLRELPSNVSVVGVKYTNIVGNVEGL